MEEAIRLGHRYKVLCSASGLGLAAAIRGGSLYTESKLYTHTNMRVLAIPEAVMKTPSGTTSSRYSDSLLCVSDNEIPQILCRICLKKTVIRRPDGNSDGRLNIYFIKLM